MELEKNENYMIEEDSVEKHYPARCPLNLMKY